MVSGRTNSSLMSIERQWYVKEYATEIHNFLREKEQSRFVHHGYSHLLPTRKAMVLWMVDVGDRHGFSNVVKHLAVYLFDMYMDNHHVGNHIKLLALGCLIVAGKLIFCLPGIGTQYLFVEMRIMLH